jgi:hypothetical protein
MTERKEIIQEQAARMVENMVNPGGGYDSDDDAIAAGAGDEGEGDER